MPTESSVVANLIRDMNTHRLPSEPSDVALFQPAPGEQPKQTTRARAAKPARVAPKPAASVAATTAAKKSTSTWKGWLQFTFATLLVGGWAYFAAQLDPYAESAAPAALPQPLPLPAVNVTPIAAPAPVIPAAPSAAQPAPAATATPAQPAPETNASAPEPAAASATADVQPSVVETSAPPAKSHASKKHRRHGSSKAKGKSVATTTVTNDAVEKPATAPPPPPKPEPAVSAKPAAPSKPIQQNDDSENPLK